MLLFPPVLLNQINNVLCPFFQTTAHSLGKLFQLENSDYMIALSTYLLTILHVINVMPLQICSIDNAD
jgi:hypothetical protein